MSGVSGTGHVATAVVWGDGEVVVKWHKEGSGICTYRSLDHAIAIHGHEGSTVFERILSGDEMLGEA